MSSKLFVFHQTQRVGQITVDDKQRWTFQYDSSWIHLLSFPISVRLPLQEAPFEDDISKPFFSNLLPEGSVRKYIASQSKQSPKNDFKMLEALGGECAGALSVYPEGVRPFKNGNYRELKMDELKKKIDQLPRKPLLIADAKARLSLAGAQEKIPLYYEDRKLFFCEEGSPSSHILKPPIPGYEDSVQNEAFCMKIASCWGLNVPFVEIIDCKGMPLYLIKRYDREKKDHQKKITRIHQEDFCQALGKYPDEKYQHEGGPSFQDCFHLIDSLVSPAVFKKELISWVVFNFLIGNCDAHAKNISLLHTEIGVWLAPFYDLMSTTVYEGLSQDMAMKIGGEYNRKKIYKRHWERFAEEIGVKPGIVFNILNEFAKDLAEFSKKMAQDISKQYGGEKTLNKIVCEIEETTKRVLKY